MQNSEDLNYFRSDVICPHCEADLLDVGLGEKQILNYFYNEDLRQFEVSEVESANEGYICGNCSKPISYEITEKLEFN